MLSFRLKKQTSKNVGDITFKVLPLLLIHLLNILQVEYLYLPVLLHPLMLNCSMQVSEHLCWVICNLQFTEGLVCFKLKIYFQANIQSISLNSNSNNLFLKNACSKRAAWNLQKSQNYNYTTTYHKIIVLYNNKKG